MRGLSLLALSAATACFTSVTLGANGTVDLVVAATTDVHGYIEGWNYLTGRPDTLRGLARLATIVDSIRRSTGAMPILVDAGDMLQGTALTYVAARIDTTVRNPVIAAMNAMEYDAAVIGNHEFDYGLPALDRALKQANFPPARRQRVRAERTAALRRMDRRDPTRRQESGSSAPPLPARWCSTAISSPDSFRFATSFPTCEARFAKRETRAPPS